MRSNISTIALLALTLIACGKGGSDDGALAVDTDTEIGNLTEVTLQVGDTDAAREAATDGLALARAVGSRRLEGSALRGLARVEYTRGDDATARCLLLAALACHADTGTPISELLSRMELVRIDVATDPASALAWLDPVDLACGDADVEAIARALRGEARGALGDQNGARHDVETALAMVSWSSAPLAVDALCAGARALGDGALLARAETLSDRLRSGSPGARELARTRRLLRGPTEEPGR